MEEEELGVSERLRVSELWTLDRLKGVDICASKGLWLALYLKRLQLT